MIKEDFHIHTELCHHAVGKVEDYVDSAVQKKVVRLGISDHGPFPDDRWSGERMSYEELSGYLQEIGLAATLTPQIRIFRGLEIEYVPEFTQYYRSLKTEFSLDYLILGQHYIPQKRGLQKWKSSYGGIQTAEDLFSYASILCEGMESGFFAFVAHPDLFGNSYLNWDKNCEEISHTIARSAEKTKVALEINGYGFRKEKIRGAKGSRRMYPWEPFWELVANYDVEVILNSDAHHPDDILASMEEAEQLAHKYNLSIGNANFLR